MLHAVRSRILALLRRRQKLDAESDEDAESPASLPSLVAASITCRQAVRRGALTGPPGPRDLRGAGVK